MRLFYVLSVLLLSSCGYHLVGHGDGTGVIPPEVSRLVVVAQGTEAEQQLTAFRDGLQTRELTVLVQSAGGEHGMADDAMLLIQVSPVSFTPSAYDVSGVASQYRMIYTGQLTLLRQGKTLWQSGSVSERGEVYVTADPTSIEASRQQLLRNLRKQWRQTAISRMRSGF